MAQPLEIIHLAMTHDEPVAWPELTNAIAALADTKSAEAEQALVDLLAFPGPLNLTGGGYAPHSQSPVDMIRMAAIDTLWRWTGTRYAALCREVASGPVSPIVKRMVAARFPAEPVARPEADR